MTADARTVTLVLVNDEPTLACADQDTALAYLEDRYALNPAELDDVARGETCLVNDHGDTELALTEVPLRLARTEAPA